MLYQRKGLLQSVHYDICSRITSIVKILDAGNDLSNSKAMGNNCTKYLFYLAHSFDKKS